MQRLIEENDKLAQENVELDKANIQFEAMLEVRNNGN